MWLVHTYKASFIHQLGCRFMELVYSYRHPLCDPVHAKTTPFIVTNSLVTNSAQSLRFYTETDSLVLL